MDISLEELSVRTSNLCQNYQNVTTSSFFFQMGSKRKQSDPSVFTSSSSSSSSSTRVKGRDVPPVHNSKREKKATTTTKTVEKKKPLAEILVVHRPRRSISHWWRSLQILSFFLAFLGGVCSTIALGRLSNSFGGECLLFTSMAIGRGANLSDMIESRYITVIWGQSSDCSFCQFAPMAGACFAVLLSAIFMQCGGRAVEAKASSLNVSWILVPPSIPICLTFFVVSCVSLANTVSGLVFFCTSVIEKSHASLNIKSCPQVFKLSYPSTFGPTVRQGDIDRYSNFLIAEIGSSLHFVGWFLGLFILLIRCFTHADFHVLSRKKGSSLAMMKGSPETNEYLPLVMNEETETLI